MRCDREGLVRVEDVPGDVVEVGEVKLGRFWCVAGLGCLSALGIRTLAGWVNGYLLDRPDEMTQRPD